MKVFISYSVDSTELVTRIADGIKASAEVYYWAYSQVPGEEAWKTIFGWIDAADLVLVLVSDKTINRAFSVGQEVGHAKKAGKLIIPLVGQGVNSEDLGCLAGTTYIPLDPGNTAPAMAALQSRVDDVLKDKQLRSRKQQEARDKAFLVAGAALFLCLLSKD